MEQDLNVVLKEFVEDILKDAPENSVNKNILLAWCDTISDEFEAHISAHHYDKCSEIADTIYMYLIKLVVDTNLLTLKEDKTVVERLFQFYQLIRIILPDLGKL